VTPRIHELRSEEFGCLVLEVGKRKCKVTGGTAYAWKAKYPVLPPARDDRKIEETQATLL
jgi:hypothetical protein